MNNQVTSISEDFTNSITTKVICDIDDLKKGDIAYVSPDRIAKKGDIVLCGKNKNEWRLSMFENQADIIGTVSGRYRSVA